MFYPTLYSARRYDWGNAMYRTSEVFDMRDAFHNAALDGWANDAETVVNPHTGEKSIERSCGHYLVRDAWFTGLDGFFCGTFRMSDRTRSVWSMQYFGKLTEEAVEVVKEALRYQYLIGDFRGGRGPRVRPAKELVYWNEVDGDFIRFSAMETVHKLLSPNADVLKSPVISWCRVQGGLLADWRDRP